MFYKRTPKSEDVVHMASVNIKCFGDHFFTETCLNISSTVKSLYNRKIIQVVNTITHKEKYKT